MNTRLISLSIQTPFERLRKRSRLWACAIGWALLLASASAVASTNGSTVRSGHSGHWYDPERDGEGLVLEMLDTERAGLYWYTYDDDGGQRWLTGLGTVERDEAGEYLSFPSLIVTRGARFGPDFRPSDVQREQVGTARLRFTNCDLGEFSFNAFGQALDVPIQRLAHVMGMSCETRNGALVRESGEQAGQTGSWFDPSHDGEGFTLQWMDASTALLTWYSYDSEGNQYWMVGAGGFDARGDLHFPELQATRGARFGDAFDSADVERFRWGELSLQLECSAGQLAYRSNLPGFGEGSLDLQRLTLPPGLSCPYQRPKLTDLYEMGFDPLPISEQTRGFVFRGITDSGVVVLLPGGFGNTVRRYVMQEERWEELVYPLPASVAGTTEAVVVPASDMLLGRQHVWSKEQGWEPQEVPARYARWLAVNGTPSLDTRVGQGFTVADSPSTDEIESWVWDRDSGYSVLPRVEGRFPGYPVCVSENASVVGGFMLRNMQGGPVRRGAIAWVERADSVSVRDRTGSELSIVTRCTRDGVILGADQTVPPVDHPNRRQAWWWKSSGVSGYLGEAEDASPGGFFVYQIMHATESGDLIVGFYQSFGRGLLTDGFLWTRNTGMVSLSTLLVELGVGLEWAGARDLSLYARATTSTGDRVLVEATWSENGELQRRGAVLTLSPHAERW